MPFVEFQPVRSVNFNGILGDIESHLPAWHEYRSSDVVNWVHEGTHGVNAYIRMSYTSKINAAYLLNSKAFTHLEPEDLSLTAVKNKVPANLRSTEFSIHFKGATKFWNKQPLYIIDELIAYINGTKVGIQRGVDTKRILFSCKQAIAFYGYFAVLLKLYSDEDLLDFYNTANMLLNEVILTMADLNIDIETVNQLLLKVVRYGSES